MPAIFFGHGNPMNAIQSNTWTEGWRALGDSMPKPKAILCVSAHWFIPGVAVTAMDEPRTIHDFGGFPKALYECQYPAPGNRKLAQRLVNLLSPANVRLDEKRGLDHGTWSVLCHVYPDADVPVVQLGIDETRPASWHYELAQRLAPLRTEGVLIAGSGNLVHNLHAYGWGRRVPEPYDWACRFEERARELLQAHDHDPLIEYEQMGRDAAMSIPTPEHYLPLLYVIAQRESDEPISFPVEGVDGGSVSMLTVQVG